MRGTCKHIAALLTVGAVALGGPAATVGSALAAAGTSVTSSPAVKKEIQEALAKAHVQSSAGGSAVGGAGSEAGNGASFSKLTEKAAGEEETTTTASKSASSTSSSTALSGGVLLPILIVGVGLLVGVAFLILRDARSVTPAGDLLSGAGNAQARAVRLRKRRAKTKAAKRQRKRNR